MTPAGRPTPAPRGARGRGITPAARMILGVVLIAAAVRALACFTDFWFDEIWSWRIATAARSAWDILAKPESLSDNNHPLNTLWIYIVGDTIRWPVYRLPALVAGVATVVLAARHARARGGADEGILTAVLLGLAFPLVTYSSEARGYGPAVLFAVGAYVSLARYSRDRDARAAIAFNACSILGFLSHLTFAHAYCAAVVWSVIMLGRDRTRARDLLRLHAAPSIMLAAYWWLFVRRLTVGGAPPGTLADALVTTLSLLIGGPLSGPLAVLAATLSATLLIASLAWLWRRRDPEFWFFVTAIAIAPTLTIALQHLALSSSEVIQPRYLLLPMTLAWLLWARVGAAMLKRPGWPRRAALTLLSVYVLGNGAHVGRFLADGRGGYAEAVRAIASASPPAGDVRVGADAADAPRTAYLFSYYGKLLGPGRSVVVEPFGDGALPPVLPQWFVASTLEQVAPGAPPIGAGDRKYTLWRQYPWYGLSGWSWAIYRLDDGSAVGVPDGAPPH